MKEKKTAYITDLNELRALDENGNIVRPPLYKGNSSVYLAYVKDGNSIKKVYNKAEYVFEAETEHEVEATAQTLDPVTNSYKCNFNPDTRKFDADREDVEYTGVLELERNDSENDKTGTFTVLQPKSGLSFECNYKQLGKKFMKYYIDINNIIVESVNYDAVGAGGGSSDPYVTVVAAKYAEYSNGTSEYVGRSVGTAYVSNAVGKAADLSDLHLVDYSDATLNTGTGEVSVSSLTTNETDAPITVFNVTHLEGGVVFEEHDGVLSWRWGGSVEVEQDINSRILVDTDYFMSSRLATNEIESTETQITVWGHAYKIDYFRYDAIPSQLYEETSDSRLYVTLDNAPESVLYIEGKEDMDVSFNVGVNGTVSERIFSVQVYNSSAGYNEEYEVKQLARVFMKYTVTRVQAMEASYEEAYPYASTCAPIVRVRVWYVAEYSDGTHDAEFYEDQSSGVSISSADGRQYDYSGATINKSTGVVSVPSLPHQADNGGKVFTVTFLSGTVKAELTDTSHSWTWGGSAEVSQMANEEVFVGTDNIRKSSVASNSIGYSNEYVTVYYQVQDVNVLRWASDRNGDYSWREVLKNYPLTISISGDYSGSKSVSDGEGSVSFHVGANSSTSSQRNFTVTVKSSTLGTIGTHSVKQGVNVYQENWNIPVLNGSISVGTVPAGGGRVVVSVPIYQEKTSNTGGVVETYEKTVAAIGLSGSAYNGGSASGGSISASNLGTNEVASRVVYIITSVTVLGGDDRTYTIPLPSPVQVKQQANIKTKIVRSSINMSQGTLSLSPQGEIKQFVIYANDYTSYSFTSGDTIPTVASGASGTISVNRTDCELSSNTFYADEYGTPYTLEVYENMSGETKEYTITATVTSGQEVSISRTLTQETYVQPESRQTMNVSGDAAFANSSNSSVNVELLFDARDTDNYKGGTVTGVYAWLSDKADGTGSTVGSGKSVGDITVSEGNYTTRSLTFGGTLGYTNLYLHVRYDNTKTFVVQVEEYVPEG